MVTIEVWADSSYERSADDGFASGDSSSDFTLS